MCLKIDKFLDFRIVNGMNIDANCIRGYVECGGGGGGTPFTLHCIPHCKVPDRDELFSYF